MKRTQLLLKANEGWRDEVIRATQPGVTSASRGNSAFAAYYRHKKAQGGPMFAQVTTAHKIA